MRTAVMTSTTLLCIRYFLMFLLCVMISFQVRKPIPPSTIRRQTGMITPGFPLYAVREENFPLCAPIRSKPALLNAEMEWKTAIHIPETP